jgi:ribosomal protein S18 acetylase RimI-like enzyme
MHQNEIVMSFIIRDAVRSDVTDIHRLIKELAVFEEAENEMVLSLDEVANDGFGDQPLYNCFVAEDSETHKVVGIALTYLRYSTWKGKALHLEDLIVEVEHRGKGIGSALLDHVISYGKSIKVRRIGWEVLDWNTNAIALYESKGAKVLKNWYVVQLENNG